MQVTLSIVSLLILVFVHLYANHPKVLGWAWHGPFLSLASGVSFAYVFVDLLPMVAAHQPILKNTFKGILPLLDKHAYVIALLGLLFSYGLHRQPKTHPKRSFYISLFGSQIFNFLIGASLADANNPEIQPLALFTVAMGLHYFVNDHNLRQNNIKLYEKSGRWILVLSLVAGFLAGDFLKMPQAVYAVLIAFISGGILLNVMHYELPKNKPGEFIYFATGALIYTLIILGLGN